MELEIAMAERRLRPVTSWEQGAPQVLPVSILDDGAVQWCTARI